MANLKDVKSKDIKITLGDGVERVLKFDLNAMAELEDKYGSVDAAFEQLDSNSIKALRYILWVGLMHEDENLTEKHVGSLIDMRYMKNLMKDLTAALAADMPTEDAEDEDAENPNV